MHFIDILNDMNHVYEKRNAEYGNSFSKLYDELGPVGAVSQMYHKMSRILVDCKDGELKEDSLLDLANYSAMTLLEIKNRK